MRPPPVPRRRPAAALFLPPLAVLAALGSIAAHQRDPVAGAETAYLAVLAAALLAAVAAAEAAAGGRRGGLTATAAVLTALAGWALPAGPSRVAAVVALAAAALVVAVVAGAGRARSAAGREPTAADALAVALPPALAFQALVGAERLLAAEPGWRLPAELLGGPLIAAAAAAFLAVRAGRAPAFAAAATAALLGPGFTPATVGALAALAGAEAAWRPRRAGAERRLGAAVAGAAVAAVAASGPGTAVAVAAAALALGGGGAALLAVAAGAAGVVLAVTAGAGIALPGRPAAPAVGGALAPALAAVAPSLVPLVRGAVRGAGVARSPVLAGGGGAGGGWIGRLGEGGRRAATGGVLAAVAVALAGAGAGRPALAAPLAGLALVAGRRGFARGQAAGAVETTEVSATASRARPLPAIRVAAAPVAGRAGAAGGGGTSAALVSSFAGGAPEPAAVAGFPLGAVSGRRIDAPSSRPGEAAVAAASPGAPSRGGAEEAGEEGRRGGFAPSEVAAGAAAGHRTALAPGAGRADEEADAVAFTPQVVWSGALAAAAALAAAPPWLRAEPLAAALGLWGAGPGWIGTLAVAAAAALVVAAAALLARLRGARGGHAPATAARSAALDPAAAGAAALDPAAASHPARVRSGAPPGAGDAAPSGAEDRAAGARPGAGGSGRPAAIPSVAPSPGARAAAVARRRAAAALALGALFAAALAALPRPAGVDLLAAPAALDAASPRLVLDLPAGAALPAAAGLAVAAETSLSHAVAVPAGAPVATVRLDPAAGAPGWTLRAGIDTAEWAIRRPDVAASAAHPAAPHWLARVTGEGFFGLVFRSRGELAVPAGAARLVVERDPALPAEAVVHLHRLQVRR